MIVTEISENNQQIYLDIFWEYFPTFMCNYFLTYKWDSIEMKIYLIYSQSSFSKLFLESHFLLFV